MFRSKRSGQPQNVRNSFHGEDGEDEAFRNGAVPGNVFFYVECHSQFGEVNVGITCGTLKHCFCLEPVYFAV